MGERGKSTVGPVKARHSPGRVGNIVLDMTRLPLQPTSVSSSMSAICASNTLYFPASVHSVQPPKPSSRHLPDPLRRVSSAPGRVSSLGSLVLVGNYCGCWQYQGPWSSSGLATQAAAFPASVHSVQPPKPSSRLLPDVWVFGLVGNCNPCGRAIYWPSSGGWSELDELPLYVIIG